MFRLRKRFASAPTNAANRLSEPPLTFSRQSRSERAGFFCIHAGRQRGRRGTRGAKAGFSVHCSRSSIGGAGGSPTMVRANHRIKTAEGIPRTRRSIRVMRTDRDGARLRRSIWFERSDPLTSDSVSLRPGNCTPPRSPPCSALCASNPRNSHLIGGRRIFVPRLSGFGRPRVCRA